MRVGQLIDVLKGWDTELKIVDKNEESVNGARIIIVDGGVEAKVKLG